MLSKFRPAVLALLIMVLIAQSAGSVFASESEISRLVLNKNDVSLEAGETTSLTATAVYVNGNTSDVTIKTEWSSGTTDVATVYAGAITAKKEGTAVITATYLGKTVVVNVTVSKKVKALTMSVNDFDLRIGKEKQIELTAIYEDGSSEAVTKKAAWSVDNYSVANVINGLVTGKKSGYAKITAKYGNQSVTIEAAVEIARRLDVAKSELSLLLNEEKTIELTATYPDGTTENVADKAEWKSDDDKVADAIKGTIKAYKAGKTTITATYGTKSVTIEVSVDASRKLEASKEELFLRTGTSEKLTLTLTYMDGRQADVTDKAKWSSSDEAVAFASKGEIFAYKSGEAEITAIYGDKSVKIQVDVEVPKRLDLDSDTIDLELNASKELKLYATFADGNKELITDKAQWSSDNKDIADITLGKVTGYKSGTTQIKASYGGKQISATVRVDVPNQITIDKDSVDMQVGATLSLKANANYDNNRVVDITQTAEWTSSSPEVVEVNKGTITAIKDGTSTITVKYGNRTATTVVSVGVIEKLTPSEKKIVLRKNKEATITLTAKYKDGTTKDVTTSAEWQSSKPDVASVYKGNVTANGNGTAVITATFGGEKVTINVEVDVAEKLTADIYTVLLELSETKQVTLTAIDGLDNKSDVTDAAEWSVSSKTVAEVNNGLISALAVGKTNVTAKFGGKTVTISVEVGSVQKLEASTEILTMQSGTTETLKITATLPDGRTKDVTDLAEWKSANVKVASVNQGKVTAQGYGKTRITAKYNGKTVTINLDVDMLKYLDVYNNSRPTTQLVLKRDQTIQLEGIATYMDNTERNISSDGVWSSSKATVAHVKHGLITAQGKGKATLTVKFGNKSAKIRIVVE
ncbi:Ig domain-containing protein [Paenibacillus sp. GCM10012307]|uniref:Ig-like domain-containing protein n=1 Tax=Paenibacillus roseus TaxID=2798579 RepID=A0A934J249_9BACL|nr:Ig-like domain-containing protein [Paenibacillus roseus]MBJ6361904.1 Ig-like domain-containing protein [Paenibacillus roseus]